MVEMTKLLAPKTLAKMKKLTWHDRGLHEWAAQVAQMYSNANKKWHQAVMEASEAYGISPAWDCGRFIEGVPGVGDTIEIYYSTKVVEVLGNPSFWCRRVSLVLERANGEVCIKHFTLEESNAVQAFRRLIAQISDKASATIMVDGFQFTKGDLSGCASGIRQDREF